MTYIENIFICMVSPLLLAALCMGRRQLGFFLFCIAGMGVCLLSAYINTFLSKGRATPFEGWKVHAACRLTICGDKIAYNALSRKE